MRRNSVFALLIFILTPQLSYAQPGNSENPERLYREWQQTVWSSLQGVSVGVHSRFINSANRGMKNSPADRFGFQLIRGIIRSHQSHQSNAPTKKLINDKASLDIKNALQHNPELLGGLALYELANIYVQDANHNQNPQKINDLFSQAMELNPHNVMGRIYYARWLRDQDKKSEFNAELAWIAQTIKAHQHSTGYLYEIVRGHELLGTDFQSPIQ